MNKKKKRLKKTNKHYILSLLMTIIFSVSILLCLSFDINKELKTINVNSNIQKEIDVITSHSKYRLNIKSVYGDIEAYHPKVIYFKDKWHGYKYWMAYTPYPNGNDKKENPHIMVSNDMINWISPSENVNPLDEPEEPILFKRYNSDAVIVYNDDLDILECYWRYVDDIENKAIMYKTTSTDGINWTPKKEFMISNDRNKFDFLSPAIIYEDELYKIWYVDKNNTLKYTETTDGINFKEERIINIECDETIKIWHLDVEKTDKGYEIIFVAYPDYSLYRYMDLYYTKSTDNINYEKAIKILEPSINKEAWDSQGIYKSSLIYVDDIYYIFYSAHNETIKGTGILFGQNIKNLYGTNIDYSEYDAVERFKKLVEQGVLYEKNPKNYS